MTKNYISKYYNRRSSNGRKKKKIVGNLGGGDLYDDIDDDGTQLPTSTCITAFVTEYVEGNTITYQNFSRNQ
jgi:hypothetical protein